METRQNRLKGWETSVKRLAKKTVAVVGVGGTGCTAALHLALGGVNLRLIDRDIVEAANLGHQILYGQADLALPKATVAAEKLRERNPDVKIEALAEDLHSKNAEKLLDGVDAIVDGTDNLETRRLLNEVSVKQRLPFTYSAAIGSKGLFAFMVPEKTFCLSCFLTKTPKVLDTCGTAGVLGPVASLIGSLTAAATLTYLTTGKILFRNSLLGIDLQEGTAETARLERRKGCVVCGKKRFHELGKQPNTAALCGGFFQILGPTLDLNELADQLGSQPTKGTLHVKLGNQDVWFFQSGRALVRGAASAASARALVSKLRGI